MINFCFPTKSDEHVSNTFALASGRELSIEYCALCACRDAILGPEYDNQTLVVDFLDFFIAEIMNVMCSRFVESNGIDCSECAMSPLAAKAERRPGDIT